MIEIVVTEKDSCEKAGKKWCWILFSMSAIPVVRAGWKKG